MLSGEYLIRRHFNKVHFIFICSYGVRKTRAEAVKQNKQINCYRFLSIVFYIVDSRRTVESTKPPFFNDVTQDRFLRRALDNIGSKLKCTPAATLAMVSGSNFSSVILLNCRNQKTCIICRMPFICVIQMTKHGQSVTLSQIHVVVRN